MIKKDLKLESTEILEEFKKDLKLSITKIEGQLQDKVDKFGLMEFGKKLNSQLYTEMKGKIDKKELSKNKMYFNKKIDNLENTISRTLVDTFIDLQMEEAPLMTKNRYFEDGLQKCASCNQKLPPGNDYVMLTNRSTDLYLPYTTRQTFKRKIIQEKEKEKLPEIRLKISSCK